MSRGRPKEKRKRKGHRGSSVDGPGEHHLDASQSKKTCPLKNSPTPQKNNDIHPEVRRSVFRSAFKCFLNTPMCNHLTVCTDFVMQSTWELCAKKK